MRFVQGFSSRLAIVRGLPATTNLVKGRSVEWSTSNGLPRVLMSRLLQWSTSNGLYRAIQAASGRALRAAGMFAGHLAMRMQIKAKYKLNI